VLQRIDTEFQKGRPGQEGEGGSYPMCGSTAGVHGALPGEGDEPAEILGVSVSGQTNMG